MQWTTASLLAWTIEAFEKAEVDSPRLDAELLLAHVLQVDRLQLFMYPDRPAGTDERENYRALVKRRLAGECVAYILGYRDFYEHRFAVTPDVLVPRPETEHIVERALHQWSSLPEGACVDIGTGSGCIALSIMDQTKGPTARSWECWDISGSALAVARRNAATVLGQDVAHPVWRESDALMSMPDSPFALVVSNPPYIAATEMPELGAEVLAEPHVALVGGGEDGADWYRGLIANLDRWLVPNGVIILEIGHSQADIVVPLLRAAGVQSVDVYRDFAGHQRIVEARK